jgi:hypothetical protein
MQIMSRARVWIIVGVVVFIAIITTLIFWVLPKANRSGTVTLAPPGQTISGFPRSLLIDSGGQISQSYSIGYLSTTNQYTVEWVSSSSPRTLAVGYDFYFDQNGTANFVATSGVGGTDVVLSYVPAEPIVLAKPSLPDGFPSFLIPDTSSTLVAVGGNASSGTVIFQTSQNNIESLVTALLVSLKANQWNIIQNQQTTSFADVAASSPYIQVFILFRPGPKTGTEVQVMYQKQ